MPRMSAAISSMREVSHTYYNRWQKLRSNEESVLLRFAASCVHVHCDGHVTEIALRGKSAAL